MFLFGLFRNLMDFNNCEKRTYFAVSNGMPLNLEISSEIISEKKFRGILLQ